MSPKGILRWQAECCGAILFNTVRNPKISFATLRTDRLQDGTRIGPLIAQTFIRDANGKQKHKGLATLIWRSVKRVGKARLTGSWKSTPFFDTTTMQPIRNPYVLSKSERDALL